MIMLSILATSGDLVQDFDPTAMTSTTLQHQDPRTVVIFPDFRFLYATTLDWLLLVSTEAGTVTFCVFRRISGNDYHIVALVDFNVPLGDSSVSTI